jgi:hypothetical protein
MPGQRGGGGEDDDRQERLGERSDEVDTRSHWLPSAQPAPTSAAFHTVDPRVGNAT